MPKQDEPKVVPPRNDPSPLEPYAKSQALQLQGRDPGFHYQWFGTDPSVGATYAGKRLFPHEIGDVHTGFLMVDAWERVQQGTGVTQGRLSGAAGDPTDTSVTNGNDMILLRTPLMNYAKYAVIEAKRQALIDKRLTSGESENFGKTSFKTRTSGGKKGLDAQVNDILSGV